MWSGRSLRGSYRYHADLFDGFSIAIAISGNVLDHDLPTSVRCIPIESTILEMNFRVGEAIDTLDENATRAATDTKCCVTRNGAIVQHEVRVTEDATSAAVEA